jgi:hypothetical protein
MCKTESSASLRPFELYAIGVSSHGERANGENSWLMVSHCRSFPRLCWLVIAALTCPLIIKPL